MFRDRLDFAALTCYSHGHVSSPDSAPGLSGRFPRVRAAVRVRALPAVFRGSEPVPECGPGLEYMLRRFPLHRALEKVLAGSGECAEVGWTFLGLSIAGWSLVWFVLLGAFGVALAVIGARRGAKS
ncbi:MAG: disulfide bond formation protein B [Betaproteobacteria bacterium]|nr:disulfide bond formation protein B [Betaproteobacteria bacterium]